MVTYSEELKQCMRIAEEREALYASSWQHYGPVMHALFPEGITLNSPEDHQAFHLMTMIVAKLRRMAVALGKPAGHLDSARDLINYTAMLATVWREAEVARMQAQAGASDAALPDGLPRDFMPNPGVRPEGQEFVDVTFRSAPTTIRRGRAESLNWDAQSEDWAIAYWRPSPTVADDPSLPAPPAPPAPALPEGFLPNAGFEPAAEFVDYILRSTPQAIRTMTRASNLCWDLTPAGWCIIGWRPSSAPRSPGE